MPTLIGITGQFGSGCSTLSDIIAENYRFSKLSFSTYIKEIARKRGIRNPTRQILQNIGNEYREKKGTGFWSSKILEKIDMRPNQNYIIDGFRNLAEINLFRKSFPHNFYLIALNVEDKNVRWLRVKNIYTQQRQKAEQFDIDDIRDRGERFPWGQQVASCIDTADILIDNTKNLPFKKTINEYLKPKLKRYISFMKENYTDRLSPNEIRMHMAYQVGDKSPCIHRHVGAIIFNKKNGKTISVGYNKPPFNNSCAMKYGDCHKDLRMDDLWEETWKWVNYKPCPNCNNKLRNLKRSYYYCPKCNYDIKSLIIPTKGSDHCVAIHAEDMAILNAKNKNLTDSVLFTTTFPCLQCAIKIVYAGISSIYYVDSYPLPETNLIKEDLFKNKVRVKKFEGIKSIYAFKNLFPPKR